MKAVLTGLGVCLALVLGQVVEQPLSFDSKGELYRLTAEANAGTAAFPELSGFEHLEMWRTIDGPVLEVYRATLPFFAILLLTVLVITYGPALSLSLVADAP